MKITDLKVGDVVTVRTGRAGRTSPDWSAWREAIIVYLVRRDLPLSKSLQKRSTSPNIGDIISLDVEGWSAEYSQADYCGNGLFLVEDWYLEIKELAHH
jgi:hypothetical protein